LQAAILHHTGKCANFRKALNATTLGDIIKGLDMSRLKSRDFNLLISAFWLAGCAEAALKHLETADYTWGNQSVLPSVTSDCEFMRELGAQVAVPMFQRMTLAFSQILEQPDNTQKIFAYLSMS